MLHGASLVPTQLILRMAKVELSNTTIPPLKKRGYTFVFDVSANRSSPLFGKNTVCD